MIGRSRQCDIVLNDPNVSRQHAEIRPRGGAWVLSDLGSTNSTSLNGRRIQAPEVVKAGDEIEVGTSKITFELEYTHLHRADVQLAPVSVDLKFAFLTVLYLFLIWVAWSAPRDMRRPRDGARAGSGGPDRRSHQHLHGRVPLGRSRPRTTRAPVVEHAPGHQAGIAYDLMDPATSAAATSKSGSKTPSLLARHAKITRQGHELMIEDLGSTNGTYLNDEALNGPQPLHDGDRIRIGDSEFSYLQQA